MSGEERPAQRSGRGPHAGPEGFSLAPGSVGWVLLGIQVFPRNPEGIFASGPDSVPDLPRGTLGKAMEIGPAPPTLGTTPPPSEARRLGVFCLFFSYRVKFPAVFVMVFRVNVGLGFHSLPISGKSILYIWVSALLK